MARRNTKLKPPLKTKDEVQVWWARIRDVAAKAVERLNLTGIRGNTLDVTFCEQPEELIKFAHSLAVNNAYQVYKEALGEPLDNDVEMQNCRLARDRIVHDFELISQSDRDKYLEVIAQRLKSAGLID